MSGVYKRASDEKRGKAGKYTAWYIGADGKKKAVLGTTDRKESEQIAADLEYQARQVRLGLVDPADRHRREASARPIEEHLEDYRLDQTARENDEEHVKHTISAIRRLLKSASIEFIADITPDKIRAAVGRKKASGSSARTCNYALGATKSFIRWLEEGGRIKEYPAGLRKVKPYPKDSDRKRVRRPLTEAELRRLLVATEKGPEVVTKWSSRHGTPLRTMTGPDRAMCYRLVMDTGLRAKEIRTLKPERFHLDGDSPTVTVAASFSKRGKRTGRADVQPMTRAMAGLLKPWLEGKPAGETVFPLKIDKNASILYDDLRAAGIEPFDEQGRVVDFHALRHSYVTHLSNRGVNPKLIQKLARHSSIDLTMNTYTTVEDSALRDAIEGNGKHKGRRNGR